MNLEDKVNNNIRRGHGGVMLDESGLGAMLINTTDINL